MKMNDRLYYYIDWIVHPNTQFIFWRFTMGDALNNTKLTLFVADWWIRLIFLFDCLISFFMCRMLSSSLHPYYIPYSFNWNEKKQPFYFLFNFGFPIRCTAFLFLFIFSFNLFNYIDRFIDNLKCYLNVFNE